MVRLRHIPAAARAARSRDVVPAVALALTLVIALALRLYGIEWDSGYPFTPHPDERAILMKVGELDLPSPGDVGDLLDADRSPLNPRWFPYGSFPLYLLKAFQGLLSAVPGVEIHDLRVIGRALSAIADTATVALVYMLGARLYGRREGLLAAILVTLAVLHVQLSHFFAVDTIMAACAVAALYLLSRVARDGTTRDSVAAGAIVGLGIATKVTLLPIYGAFLMAHAIYALGLLDDGEEDGPGLAERVAAAVNGVVLGGAASVVVFAVAQPYAFIDYARFMGDVVEQSEMVRRIRDYPYTRQYVDTTPYWYHVRQLATWGLGLPLGVVAWAGLLYAAMRGMRLFHGLAYLAAGIALPAALLMLSHSLPAIVAASAVALAALALTLPFRSAESRGTVLLLSWVVPYLLITGSFEVKFLRYMIPATPFLVLFGSRMLLDLWDTVSARLPRLRPLLVAGFFLLLAATGFYAVAYTAVYEREHPAIRTARWINANAPEGSVILKEHWEEGIPGLHGYEIRELPIYDPDTETKLSGMAEELALADYVVFYSNRLYGTIPRLPDRYPFSSEYYRLLFSGALGYELADVQTSYPGLAGVTFVDDTLSRPGVPSPGRLLSEARDGLVLSMGFADESFTVYDHPMTLVFENRGRHTAGEIERALGVGESTDLRVPGLMLTSEEAEAQRAGGTWSEIVRPASWPARLPVLSWLLVVELMSLLAVPIAFVLLRRLTDRGYLLAKPLGLLLVCLVVWLLASYELLAFSMASVGVGMAVIAVVSLALLAANWREIAAFLARRWRTLLAGEAVFLVAFLAFVLVRMANPDLWHSHLGGEKPMDMAYLNAVLKSSYMPPYDPWFGGGYINYYYWGQFMVATLIRATGIDPAIAFNLAVPLFFALTAAAAYSIVYNLASSTRLVVPAEAGTHPRPQPSHQAVEPRPSSWPARLALSPTAAGLAGAAFVVLLGNLDGAVQLVGGIWNTFVLNEPFTGFDFWRSTRVMPPDPPGHEITEFPFFTFLFADLHAHLMALPFTLLAIGLSLAVVLFGRQDSSSFPRRQKPRGEGPWLSDQGEESTSFLRRQEPRGEGSGDGDGGDDAPSFLRRQEPRGEGPWLSGEGEESTSFLRRQEPRGEGPGADADRDQGMSYLRRLQPRWVAAMSAHWPPAELALLALLGLAVGSLRAINTWDVPVYMLLAASAVLLAAYFRNGGLSLQVLIESAAKTAIVAAVGFLAFLPYHDSTETFFTSVEATTNQTVLWQFLLIHGLFVFVVGSHLLLDTRAHWLPSLRKLWLRAGESRAKLVPLGIAALLAGYLALSVITGVTGSTIPFALVLLVLAAVSGLKHMSSGGPDSRQLTFATLLVCAALGVVIGLDIFRVEGDIDRMNSVFKLYLQAWVLLAIASAYLGWRILRSGVVARAMPGPWGTAWGWALALLVFAAAVYPVLGTQARLKTRFDVLPLTLDGTAYMRATVYNDANGPIDLSADYDAIRWLQDSVDGSPVILEGLTPNYRWGGRISVYTGLPTVVGWRWHQEQQRWGYRWAVAQRAGDVDRIYSTPDAAEALDLMRKYDVEYLYLGQLERLYYPSDGLAKFAGAMSPHLDEAYRTDDVRIYRLREEAP